MSNVAAGLVPDSRHRDWQPLERENGWYQDWLYHWLRNWLGCEKMVLPSFFFFFFVRQRCKVPESRKIMLVAVRCASEQKQLSGAGSSHRNHIEKGLDRIW